MARDPSQVPGTSQMASEEVGSAPNAAWSWGRPWGGGAVQPPQITVPPPQKVQLQPRFLAPMKCVRLRFLG